MGFHEQPAGNFGLVALPSDAAAAPWLIPVRQLTNLGKGP
jgi:hypothetical protein